MGFFPTVERLAAPARCAKCNYQDGSVKKKLLLPFHRKRMDFYTKLVIFVAVPPQLVRQLGTKRPVKLLVMPRLVVTALDINIKDARTMRRPANLVESFAWIVNQRKRSRI